MPQRSKVFDLPVEIKSELDRRLIDTGFKNYKGLEVWLRELGYNISKSGLQRYGLPFEDRVAALKMATDQARAVVEATPDNEGAMNDALIRLVQEKLFNVLMAMEVDPAKIKVGNIAAAIADLGRATLSQKKWAKEARQQALKDASAAAAKAGKTAGVSPETMDKITAAIAGG